MADRVIQRNDTAARWQSINPILATGEIGIEIDGAKGYKIGDGKTRWNDLPYPANPTNVVQKLGNDENAVPSQKLVTEKFSQLDSEIHLRINTIKNTSKGHISNYFYDFVVGNKVTIDLTEIQGNTDFIGFAFRRNGEYNTNYQLKQFKANEISDSLHYEMIAEDKYDLFVVYYASSITFVKERFEINNYYNEIKKERYKYSTFSILGDSYSTFKGFTTPSTNAQWYPTNISGTQGFETGNNVTDVKQMWWYLFAEYFKCKLDVNNSYSGSPICYDGYSDGNADAKNYSFLTRASAIGNANIIIIEGGTNDSWANAQIGEYKYKDWSEEDLVYFRPACAKMINDIQLNNIGSRIIFMLNNGLKEEINSSVETICNYYGVELLKLNNISKIANHPDVNGMREIFNQLSNLF